MFLFSISIIVSVSISYDGFSAIIINLSKVIFPGNYSLTVEAVNFLIFNEE